MVKMCVRYNQRINSFYVIRKRLIHMSSDKIRALLDAAIY